MQKPLAWPLAQVDKEKLLYHFRGITNATPRNDPGMEPLSFEAIPIDQYHVRFERVMAGLRIGDSFLTNLTIKSLITRSLDLKMMFHRAKSKYKLWLNGEFLVFSPEAFVRVTDGRIHTYPMKGTIDAGIPYAASRILNDKKEMAEHVTIVDLLRNDLSRVATEVRVDRFRYLEKINTQRKALLQVSSEISGRLPADYRSHLGDIIFQLLPAGSVSGAPKLKTCSIIRESEGEPRGYYTGVAGIFDGRHLDSMVMIRFIEHSNGQFFYRSGGGITAQSQMEREYSEAINKIYVPVD